MNANSLFTLVQDVLNHAIFLAEKCFLGKQEQLVRTGSNQVSNSSSPLSILKQIACKVGYKAVNSMHDMLSKILVENGFLGRQEQVDMSILKRIACKVGCNATSNEAVNSVLDMLSKYSWAEKAVLTLAAFAMVYGELLFYVDSRDVNGFASSISSLRRVDVLIGHRQDQNLQQAFVDLNRLTKISMEMIAHILEFEKLTNLEYDGDNPSAVRLVEKTWVVVSNHSLLVIRSVIDCMAQVNYLNDDGVPKLELFGWISLLTEKLEEQEQWHKKIVKQVQHGDKMRPTLIAFCVQNVTATTVAAILVAMLALAIGVYNRFVIGTLHGE